MKLNHVLSATALALVALTTPGAAQDVLWRSSYASTPWRETCRDVARHPGSDSYVAVGSSDGRKTSSGATQSINVAYLSAQNGQPTSQRAYGNYPWGEGLAVFPLEGDAALIFGLVRTPSMEYQVYTATVDKDSLVEERTAVVPVTDSVSVPHVAKLGNGRYALAYTGRGGAGYALFDAYGAMTHVRSLRGPAFRDVATVVEMGTNIAVVGTTPGGDVVAMLVDAAGSLFWRTEAFHEPTDTAMCAIATGDGSLLVVGSSDGTPTSWRFAADGAFEGATALAGVQPGWSVTTLCTLSDGRIYGFGRDASERNLLVAGFTSGGAPSGSQTIDLLMEGRWAVSSAFTDSGDRVALAIREYGPYQTDGVVALLGSLPTLAVDGFVLPTHLDLR